ncbi:MAG: hypothetical protein SFH39_16640 [Candidatus Magnetobacterium sp. LHC-1]
MELEDLYSFINNPYDNYLSYERQVEAQRREPAKSTDDRIRRIIGMTIFGKPSEDICYAALSIDGNGLKNYGDYTICLSDEKISSKATLLEENSYKFVHRHKITSNIPDRLDIPPGYRALWADRHKLAVAKLANKLQKSFTDSEYAKILLVNGKNRMMDDFIEVHIYEGFKNEAVDKVYGICPTKKRDRTKWLAVKQILTINGKQCCER